MGGVWRGEQLPRSEAGDARVVEMAFATAAQLRTRAGCARRVRMCARKEDEPHTPPHTPKRVRHEEHSDKFGKNDERAEKYAQLDEEERLSMIKLDDFAEDWIGTDIARWEWYERMKARRSRMLKSVRKSEETLDKELGELRKSLMDMETVFGTGFLDEDSNEISALGWTTVALCFALYVAVGYALFGLVASTISSSGPSFPL